MSMFRRRIVKSVQGAYITIEAKATLEREAHRQGIFAARLASEILEKEAKRIARWEERYGENTQTNNNSTKIKISRNGVR
jgi:hypothetical protein